MTAFNLGLFPAAGGGLTTLAAAGQSERLTNYYLPAYLKTFEHVRYFSYYDEQLADFTTNPTILNSVTVVPKLRASPYRVYAFQLPFVTKQYLQTCQVLRVFQATGAIPAMLARILYGIPFVMTYGYKYHALAAVEGHRLSSLYLRVLEPLTLRSATGVIVTSPELAGYVARFVSTSKIHLIPNGVDTTLFSPTKKMQNKREQKTILFVGRLTHVKNLFRLLEALGTLATDYNIRLQIVGGGELQPELEQAARHLNVECIFEGTVPHQTLPSYMQQADLFVLPSLSEGHPKALLEAMSCGVPCVASNCEGNRIMLEHEKTGLLFEPTEVSQMAQQIGRVLDNPNLASGLGQAARQSVCAHYDLYQLLEQEVELLQTIATLKG